MNFIETRTINSGLEKDRENYIKVAEHNYILQLEAAAEKIYLERNEKPIILVSGPSGSGKTTSALKIAEFIKKKGLPVHTLSMDNYFLPADMGELPLDEDGNVDLESPKRLDTALFSEHLNKIFKCESIDVPVFDFATQSRSGSNPLVRGKNEIVIIEGIHALNPEVTGETDNFTTCVYASVRTRIVASDGEILHPRLIRLMRRLSRDRLFRGRNLDQVFSMFESVSRGEELYIMPYKERAVIPINSFIPFEAAVYAKILNEELLKISDIMEGNENYTQICKILREIHPLDQNHVPKDSFIREFIGGSSLKY